ncbi:molybdopterin oxidoreductase family protein [Arthrobacter sp. TES]|uniref:Molybdopterin oxidoreductase family protein n=1 Tax=Paenarthrobacter ureafaciens TaxID=37931 RepID=A0AAX3ELN4_PAEUR|nr:MULTISPECIES: molybdopterin oxidoreductase family protein [Paenarthrobacter]AOY72158.1 molybdopterin oxidoreductase [Arthrobacter sp. ZXY-2]ERI38566.1 nitrite reductase [Arthrobacter sp. AK-YN10]NKR11057.1 nitrite reductase [Arthrobacter sp. M5]NKR17514.1 nitrite reductase [Arthrobacter sp. M6]OEH64042.1 nitrite reductase [Arthrobacter sp. D4]OEH64646.1 nitrite reductase [Arthrobacter sp. D2]QOI63875.1 molybdopterin oxidoreductase family protein [Arthrobacter sp. TES]
MPNGADTHCPYCALQCAMTLTPAPDHGAGAAPAPAAEPAKPTAPLDVSGRDFPTNRGGLCRKGWTSASLLNHNGRVTEPLLKGSDGVHQPISWEQALALIVAAVKDTQRQYGNDAVGVFGGGGLTNEKAYMLGKFARLALRTSRIDYNGRFCMSSAAAAGNRAFGVDRGLPFPVADLDSASVILMLGSNVAETMPPFVQHLQGARDAGGLIVVDPRRSATAAFTSDGGGLHLQPTPGTDLALLLGISHVVVHEGLVDSAFVEEKTSGYASVVRSLNAFWPERVQTITGVPANLIRETARRLAQGARAGGSYILSGRGVEQHVDGTDTATAAINLSLLLGLPGSARSGYGTLTGQGNGQGGREHGQKADQLPGYRKITDPAARAHVARVWGIDESLIPGPGLPAVELLKSLGKPDGVRCLFVHGANVVVSAPDTNAVTAGLRALDFLVVCDFFMSETALEADLVLPVTQWAEEEGTLTNLEGRVIRRRRALTPPPGVRSELWLMARLAELLQAPSTFSDDPGTVFSELRQASAGGLADYSGIDYAMLDRGEAAYWPYPVGSNGTPRLFTDGFAHADGRAVMVPVTPSKRAVRSFADDSLALATGRLLEHYQSGAQTRRVAELLAAQPQVRLLIHPATAASRGITDGDYATVTNERGEVLCRAELSNAVRPDTVFLPFHFPGQENANRLTEAATDPISGMPEFKTSRVWVRRAASTPVPAVLADAGLPLHSKEAS